MNSDVINHFQLDIRDPSSALLCSLELVLWLTGINESEAERCSPAPQTPRDSDGIDDDYDDNDDDVDDAVAADDDAEDAVMMLMMMIMMMMMMMFSSSSSVSGSCCRLCGRVNSDCDRGFRSGLKQATRYK